MPLEHTGEISVREHKKGFGAIVESSPNAEFRLEGVLGV